MKLIVMAIAVFGLALGAAACNSDDDNSDARREPATLAEYFGELEDIQNDAQSRIDELEPEIDVDTSVEDGKDRLNEFFDELRAVIDDFVAELEVIDPPSDAETLHADAVEASNDFLSALDESIDQIEDIDSLSDLIGLDDPEFDDAGERFDEACRDLQELATDREIDVDLGCD